MNQSQTASPQVNLLAKPRCWRISIRNLVVSIVVFATLVTAALAIGLQYYFSRQLAIDSALSSYQNAARDTSRFIESVDQHAIQIARVLAKYPRMLNDEADYPHMHDLFSEVMRNNPIYYSIYVGYPNGDFYEVINLDGETGAVQTRDDRRRQLQALPQDHWVVNRVRQNGPQRLREFFYYDSDFRLRAKRGEPSNFDVRQRRWFVDASAGQVTRSDPYVFQYTQQPGQTYSIQLPETGAVLGIDITLQSFSDYLRNQALSRGSEIYIYRPSGEVLGTNQEPLEDKLPELPVLSLNASEKAYLDSLGAIKISNQLDWPPLDFSVAGQPRGYSVDVIRSLAAILGIKVEFINGYSWPALREQFIAGKLDGLQSISDNAKNRELGYLTAPLVTLDKSIVVKTGTAPLTSLAQVQGKSLAIPSGWSSIPVIRRYYPGIRIIEVASTRAALEAVRDGKAFATFDSSAVLHFSARQYFIGGLVFCDQVDSGEAKLAKSFHLLLKPELAALGQLMDRALVAMQAQALASLQARWLQDNRRLPRSYAIVPYEPLIAASVDPSQLGKLLPMELDGKKYFVYVGKLNLKQTVSDFFAVVVPAENLLGKSLRRVSISILFTLACLLLLIPIAWLFAEPIVRPIHRLFEKSERVKERRFKDIHYLPSRIREIDELNQSMVDMARAIAQYEREQRELMESFIQLIAEAIDEKSPYTGGHCARVPELALMLVDKAVKSESPAFKDFHFSSEDEYREFKIAAWLHDCGKIIVPEHIVDKGSKLETIYNRIHEVRMRFEVLWRDAEIACLNAELQAPAQGAVLRGQLEQTRAQLREDFAFIARTNVGGEFLSEQDQARLRQLANISWWRNFDDHLGLSPVEEQRLPEVAVELPVEEKLLADKPEHLISRARAVNYDPKFGIRMEVPEYLYNLGEIYNLSVSRGTLTAEDRFKINEHMINTIRMLEKLPFPADLKRVPRYASTHHETLKGTGYPRKLSAEDLSIPERILVVADIFEALTAADRPYKKAKTLSESVAILHKMVLDKHIDGDVFELFLRSGVYRDYGQRFLSPEQMDEVDINTYLG